MPTLVEAAQHRRKKARAAILPTATAVAARVNVLAPDPQDIWTEVIHIRTTEPDSLSAVEKVLADAYAPVDDPDGYVQAIRELLTGAAVDHELLVYIKRLLIELSDAYNGEGAICGEAGFLIGFACGQRAAALETRAQAMAGVR